MPNVARLPLRTPRNDEPTQAAKPNRRPKTHVQLRMAVTSMEQVSVDVAVLQGLVTDITRVVAQYRRRTWREQRDLAEVRQLVRAANEILRQPVSG